MRPAGVDSVVVEFRAEQLRESGWVAGDVSFAVRHSGSVQLCEDDEGLCVAWRRVRRSLDRSERYKQRGCVCVGAGRVSASATIGHFVLAQRLSAGR